MSFPMYMRFYPVIFFVLIALSGFCSGSAVTELQCNASINPIDVDDFHPFLSWKIRTAMRGQNQTAYEVIVASSADFKEAVWRTGKVNSSQSVHLKYDGPALKYNQRYYWKVKVWTTDGLESPFSETAFWDMTIDPARWQAEWVSAPAVFDLGRLNGHRYAMIRGEKHDFYEALPLYRKAFSAARKVSRAKVFIAGLGFHELYVNGQKVNDDILNPAFTNYDKTVLYNVYDVTDMIKPGANALGVMLGNGWYNSASKEVWGFDMAPWRNRPTFKMQLEITYDDNSTAVIPSDVTWLATPGPVIFSYVRQGEHYDARKEVPKWSEPGADEKSWKEVRKVGGPIGVLRPHHMPPVKITRVLHPVSSKALANGHTVYDFGQNMSGFIKIKVTGKAGTRLEFKYAEKTDATGATDQSNINNLLADSLFQIDRYTLKGAGEESWSPRFVYHGFRYAELTVTGEQAKLISAEADAISTSFENRSEFTCSSDLINKIQQSTLWSFRNNFVGFPTDCPQREKNGWTGDAQLACETGLTNFNTATSYEKWLNDLRDEQQPDGSLPGIVPTNGWGYYWGNGPAWDIACIVIPWSVYQYTGDRRVLETNYDMMKKYVDYMHSRSQEYISDFGLGDWVPVKTVTPDGVTSTGYFYYGASIVSKTAAILGKDADEIAYQQLAAKIKTAFNKKYFNPKDFTYSNASQTALSCALYQNLVPDQYRSRVTKKLEEAVHAKDNHVDVGILGARYITHALTDNGNPSLAWELVATKTYPGWGYWIENGATTLWEEWHGDGSQNHIMLGDVSSWFYKAIAGIRLDEPSPGFKHFIIRPEIIKGLTSAEGKYESVYGTIVSSWKIENTVLIHTIEIPPNSSALYYLPSAKLSAVTESGKPVDRKLFKITGTEKNKTLIELPSGKYEFRIRH